MGGILARSTEEMPSLLTRSAIDRACLVQHLGPLLKTKTVRKGEEHAFMLAAYKMCTWLLNTTSLSFAMEGKSPMMIMADFIEIMLEGEGVNISDLNSDGKLDAIWEVVQKWCAAAKLIAAAHRNTAGTPQELWDQLATSWADSFKKCATTPRRLLSHLLSTVGGAFDFTEQEWIVLSTGHVGLAHLETQPGDVVALLSGVDCPLTLRPHGGQHRIIGRTYVHGIMTGEAWPDDVNKLGWLQIA
jgi:hypothetical protein